MNEIDVLEKTKLELLSHSANMRNAAESQDWKLLSELQSNWQEKLESAIKVHANNIDVIGEQLIEDNSVIINCLKQGQKKLNADFSKNTHSTESIKKYLK